jgi:hypothetical protein
MEELLSQLPEDVTGSELLLSIYKEVCHRAPAVRSLGQDTWVSA